MSGPQHAPGLALLEEEQLDQLAPATSIPTTLECTHVLCTTEWAAAETQASQ